MKITELLDLKGIALNVNVNSKDEAIDKLVDLMDATGKISSKEDYKKGILARESLTSTGIGEGIAIPHAQVAAVKTAGLAAMTVPAGVDYESLDGQPAKLFFMIAAPEDGGNTHLQALAKLSALLMDEAFREKLMNAQSAEEFLHIIDEREAIKDAEEAAEAAKVNEGQYKVLAVTACPTGIAHTFMAAENLTKAGEAMGYPLKAETNGSEGVGNALTAEEIAAADGIIIAADKNVEMARFDGKPLLSVSVTEGIRHPEDLINKIRNGEAPIYHAEAGAAPAAGGANAAQGFYKHLMNGVSHMLPFVVAGGILIALAFLFDDKNAGANFGSSTPLAAWFNAIGGVSFGMMLPILSGFIAMSIADRPGLAVGIVGGLLAKSGATFLDPSAAKVAATPGFLGALLYGFVAGWIIILLKKVFAGLPKSLDGIKPILLYPLLGVALMGVFASAVNPIMGVINSGLTSFLNGLGKYGILLGIVAGGMMSIDMGGPFNKAAYVTATGMLASKNYTLMAAVMAGGMVPPLVIALSTTFFKDRWSEEDRNAGLVNYIMGLSFISEGAIPFAANDPIRVIPSCVLGSAIAGGLSMLFNCTLRAPHGGIFVIATIGNWPMYLASIAIGSVVGAIVLSLWKKPLNK
ncbi:PTS system D-fructose-specific IIA component (F1P-forming), Frc family /PTS system D-fructose-specific IIB component (F1P-forming), Frc family /PTS system D-fructose-specific IIC component (F1P-forming), Frc family [Kandleria vitulina]|jgi:PTS system fructose-specific IIC component|uniref:PTS fructose transporter subunit IIABC n=1 Tax=Kandleria vitulina TaxID=1630 RepID=UPI00048D86F4|nr:fructose-specific PTS transporter subunit EIIC [Kandleria vitulina]SEJ04759.1 PTS system D-fructose-specific IIA component (F1P-forming), Frc family /PTS system D-fructose-specific IIB component (F1P-forming), Frc family /PTS system D-fructose-specific IIC component (F1P-forming), Frc family [Kandleria vitulina]